MVSHQEKHNGILIFMIGCVWIFNLHISKMDATRKWALLWLLQWQLPVMTKAIWTHFRQFYLRFYQELWGWLRKKIRENVHTAKCILTQRVPTRCLRDNLFDVSGGPSRSAHDAFDAFYNTVVTVHCYRNEGPLYHGDQTPIWEKHYISQNAARYTWPACAVHIRSGAVSLQPITSLCSYVSDSYVIWIQVTSPTRLSERKDTSNGVSVEIHVKWRIAGFFS